jgi:DNA-binding XRE family transcriptional regulator
MKLENFAVNFMNIYEQSKLNKRAFCQKLGICEATYSRLSHGHSVPSVKTVINLMNVFGVPFEKLFQAKEEC